MHTKFIFVTGGVVSSLGKGITAASLGRLLKSRGLRVSMQKFDPYINVDPGTMNPYQHGEVFVTDDGAETDLDLGHYERFIDENLTQAANVTSGRVYDTVITRERKGEYLGATIQVIPHITDEIKRRMLAVSLREDAPDVVITEIGGTVGDIESLPFLEAARQLKNEVGRENVLYIHVTLVPYISAAGELKTKPTQHSVKELTGLGIQPDIIVCRSEKALTRDVRAKIGLFCNIPADCVFENLNARSIYEVPLMIHEEGMDERVCRLLGIPAPEADLTEWRGMVERLLTPEKGRPHCDCRQICRAAGCVSLYRRGADPRRHRPPCEGARGMGGGRERDAGERGGEAGRLRRRARAGRLRRARAGGQDCRRAVCPRARRAVFGHLSGHADGRGGIRPPRARSDRRAHQRG